MEPASTRTNLWVSQPVIIKRRSWDNLLFAVSGLFLFVVITIVLTRFFPQNKAALPVSVSSSPQVILPASTQVKGTLRSLPPTWTPGTAASLTPTQSFRTATPFLTPTFTITPTIDDWNYPEINPADLYANSAQFSGRRLTITGKIITFGEVELDGNLVFAIQIDPGSPDSQLTSPYPPVLVLNLSPDARLAVDLPVHVLGKGANPTLQVRISGFVWEGPVVYGEKWETIP